MPSTISESAPLGAVVQSTLDDYRTVLSLVVETMDLDASAPIATWSRDHVDAVMALLPEGGIPADRKIGSVLNALDARFTMLKRMERKAVSTGTTAPETASAPKVSTRRVQVADTEARSAVRAAMPYVPRADTLIGKYVCIGTRDTDTNRERPILVPATDAFCAAWGDARESRRSNGVIGEAALTARSATIGKRVLTETCDEFRTLTTAYAVGEAIQGTSAPETVAPPMNARQRREAARVASGAYVKA